MLVEHFRVWLEIEGFGSGLGSGWGMGRGRNSEFGEGEGEGLGSSKPCIFIVFCCHFEVPAGGHKVPARNPNPSRTLAQVSVSPLLPPLPPSTWIFTAPPCAPANFVTSAGGVHGLMSHVHRNIIFMYFYISEYISLILIF